MVDRLYLRYQETKGVFTDTRQVIKGGMFFALKGPHFNGNTFAEEALKQGARYAVVDEAEHSKDGRFILVPDVLKALQELALHHRRQLSIPFIAITGSNGKTTTKELVNAVLSQKFSTYATIGNLNNHIGVPLTILSIKPHTEIAIIEMGANKPGDIAELCAIAEPTHGLITNIGKAHLEGFGSLEGVIKTKTELYNYIKQHQGKIFINSQNPTLNSFIADFPSPILYPQAQDFFHCEMIAADPFVRIRIDHEKEANTQLIGAYNFDNVAAALCIGKYFEVPMKDALGGLKSYVPGNNRSQVVQRRNNTIILDAYNANPDSMKASLSNFKSIKADKKMLILGDMLELGADSAHEHQILGALAEEIKAEKMVFYGELMKDALINAPQAYYFTDKFSLRNWLSDLKLEGYHILIKGSRGMGLEQVVESI